VPVLSKAGLRIDYADEGTGPPVVLIHRSVSGNRQWQALTEPELVNPIVREFLAGG
jgi:pimeloyl-ACP methyl ester carboxylesterase